MNPHDCLTSPSRFSAGALDDANSLPRIRHHATHVLDQWTVEIFQEPAQNDFLARVAGLPGIMGRGSTEAASVSQLRHLLRRA